MLTPDQHKAFSKIVADIRGKEIELEIATRNRNPKAIKNLNSEIQALVVKKNQILISSNHTEMAAA